MPRRPGMLSGNEAAPRPGLDQILSAGCRVKIATLDELPV